MIEAHRVKSRISGQKRSSADGNNRKVPMPKARAGENAELGLTDNICPTVVFCG